jgi:hypothetical protein
MLVSAHPKKHGEWKGAKWNNLCTYLQEHIEVSICNATSYDEVKDFQMALAKNT